MMMLMMMMVVAALSQAEMEGLRALDATDTIRVPKPISTGVLSDGHSFIAMEFIDSLPFGPSIEAVAIKLGEGM